MLQTTQHETISIQNEYVVLRTHKCLILKYNMNTDFQMQFPE